VGVAMEELTCDFEIDFVSDINCEYLMVEVYYQKQRLFRINKEKGIDKLEIEFLTDLYIMNGDIKFRFPLTDFENILKKACELLITA
jgi:hypothetical protein